MLKRGREEEREILFGDFATKGRKVGLLGDFANKDFRSSLRIELGDLAVLVCGCVCVWGGEEYIIGRDGRGKEGEGWEGGGVGGGITRRFR